MPFSLSQRDPILHAEALSAFERATLSQYHPKEISRSIGGSALALPDILAAKVKEAEEAGALPGQTGLEKITDPEVREVFERSLETTKAIYAKGQRFRGLDVPSYELFTNLDIARLGERFQDMESKDLEPQVLITPQLSKQDTISLFSDRTKDDNVLRQGGLWVNDKITDTIWDELNVPHANQPTLTTPDGTVWTITLTSGTQKPQNLKMSHNDLKAMNVPLLTISQYTRLQLGNIQEGRPPVDGNTWTWLSGTFSAGAAAPYGRWFPGLGRVGVDWLDVGCRGGYLGSRSPEG